MTKQMNLNKICFGLGTIGRDALYSLISMYLLVYLNDVVIFTEQNSLIIGGVLTAFGIFDAVIDPFVGAIVDKTRTKWGKFKPWILIGMIGTGLLTVAMFHNIEMPEITHIILLCVCYLLFSIFFSLNDIAYWSLMPALSKDQKERESIGSFARICANIGMYIVMVAWQPVTSALGNTPKVWFLCAVVIAVIYFIYLLRKNEKNTVIKFSPKNYTLSDGIPKEILLVGFPSFVMMLMGTFSNLVLNKMVVSYSNQAIAGMGIAKKIDMLAFAIANGMTQGVLPLIGYNFASGNHTRMRAVIKTSFLYTMIVSTVGAVILFVGAVPVVRFFINDAETVAYGQHFLRIISITCPAISITMMIISIFQATGRKLQPMILSLLRKGGFDIPFMFIMNSALGADGIPWATPISDMLAMFVALALFVPYWIKLKKSLKHITERSECAIIK